MSKTAKKLICAVLAICIVVSCMVPAFSAGVTYKAAYTETASKELYKHTLEDVDAILAKEAIDGSLIEAMYLILPDTSAICKDASTKEFYKKADAKIFKHLDEFMQANGFEKVTKEVLTAYFAQHPVILKDLDEFTLKLNAFIEAFMNDKIFGIVKTAINMGSSKAPSVGKENLPVFLGSFDMICEAIGAKQDAKLYDIIKDRSMSSKDMAKYLNNIVNALLPNLTENVFELIKTVSRDENNQMLYKGLTTALPMLHDVLNSLTGIIGTLIPGADLSGIVDTVKKVSDTVLALPTIGEGEDKMFELQNTIKYILNDVLMTELTGARMDIIKFKRDKGAAGIITLSDMNFANTAYADDATDTFNVVFHYLHKNLNTTGTKILLKALLKALPGLVPNIPTEVISYLNFVLKNKEDASVAELHNMLHKMAEQRIVFTVKLNGEEDGNYKAGTKVNVKAPQAPEGKEFDRWEVTKGNAVLDDAQSETTSFEMPSEDVELTAHFKNINYTLKIDGLEDKTYTMGEIVEISAPEAPEGMQFLKWTVVSGDVTLADENDMNTSFIMPASDVVLKAEFKDIPVVEPETDTTVPETDTTVPETDTTVPETDTTVPETDTTVPETDTTVPETDTTVPETDTTVPETDTTVPETDTTVPETDTTAPETDTTAPETDTTVPETDTTAPETDTTAPETDATAPETDATAPETDATAPEIDTTVTETETDEQVQSEDVPNTGASAGIAVAATALTAGVILAVVSKKKKAL